MPVGRCYACGVDDFHYGSWVIATDVSDTSRNLLNQRHSGSNLLCSRCVSQMSSHTHDFLSMCDLCRGIADERRGHIGAVMLRENGRHLCNYCNNPRGNSPIAAVRARCYDIKSYGADATSLLKRPLKENILYSGIEIEVGVYDNKPRKAREVIDLLGEDYAICKRDSSIDGFEIVTIPATRKEHALRLEKLCSNRPSGIKSWSDSTCGMHIHLSNKPISPCSQVKMSYFINNRRNRDFMVKIAGRDSERYAAYDSKSKLAYYVNPNNHTKSYGELGKLERYKRGLLNRPSRYTVVRWNDERHEALNFHKRSTIEFRIFKSTLRYERIMSNLEFCYALVNFCNVVPLKKDVLTYHNFYDFVQESEYSHLKHFTKEIYKELCA